MYCMVTAGVLDTGSCWLDLSTVLNEKVVMILYRYVTEISICFLLFFDVEVRTRIVRTVLSLT